MRFKRVLLISLILAFSGFSLGQPSLPQEISGDVEINGDTTATEMKIYVGGELSTITETNSRGEFEDDVVGGEGEEITFSIEDKLNETISPERKEPNSITYTSGGEKIEDINLEFTVEDPEPRVYTENVIETGQEFAVVKASTSFINEDAYLTIKYGDTETDPLEINSSKEYEFNLTDLEYDTEYEYQAYLEVNEDSINGSKKEFTTDNRPGMEILGESSVNDGRAEAWIDDELIFNESVENGRFSFEIDYKQEYRFDDLRVRFRDKEEEIEFESGENKELFFNITETGTDEGEDDTDSQINSENERTSERDDSSDSSGRSNSSEENNASDEDESDVESETEKQNETRPQPSESLTGEFFQNQVNNTTIILFLAVVAVGIYTLRAY